jgi:DNA-binding XRE family transcriptional regulator
VSFLFPPFSSFSLLQIFYHPFLFSYRYLHLPQQLFSKFEQNRPKSLLIVRFMNIGDKITTLRKQKDMSQIDLGKAVGVSREIIGRYERNEVLPSIEVAAKIANALEVSLDYLAGNTAKKIL